MKDFNQFEDQLRESLRRVEAPAGLEQRILARVGAKVEAKRRFVYRRWLAAAASVVMVVSAGTYGMHYRRQQQTEQVRQQLVLALQITSKQLSKTEGQLRSIGVQRIDLMEVTQ